MENNLSVRQIIALLLTGALLGQVILWSSVGIAQVTAKAKAANAHQISSVKGEAPTLVVRCYASNVSLSGLPIELDYLQAYGWQDITVRSQPGTQSLMKVSARAYYTLEASDVERLDRILDVNPDGNAITCG